MELVITIVGDIVYRVLINQKPELITTEIIIFSLVHTLYQLVGVKFLSYHSIWEGNTILATKLILLLMLYIFTMYLYRSIQDALRERLTSTFENLTGQHPDKRDSILHIRDVALDYIDAQIWKSFSEKKIKVKRRLVLIKLLNDIGVSDFTQNELLIENTRKYQWGIGLLTVICVIVGIFPA
jgi:hypothetical protein